MFGSHPRSSLQQTLERKPLSVNCLKSHMDFLALSMWSSPVTQKLLFHFKKKNQCASLGQPSEPVTYKDNGFCPETWCTQGWDLGMT